MTEGQLDRVDWLEEAWTKTREKTWCNVARIGDGFPHASVNGTYVLEEPHWWTAGFWPGLLWYMYEEENTEKFRETAESCESRLDAVLDDYVRLDHDLGFMWTLTSVASYKLQGDEASKNRALKAANYLVGRFNLRGRYIRAWNPWNEGENNAGYAIIDCAMNTPLLYWASRETGIPVIVILQRRIWIPCWSILFALTAQSIISLSSIPGQVNLCKEEEVRGMQPNLLGHEGRPGLCTG